MTPKHPKYPVKMDSISTLPPPPSHILDAALKEEAKYVGEMGAKILTIKEAEPYFKDILFRAKIGARLSPIGEAITKNLQRLRKELERGANGLIVQRDEFGDAIERMIENNRSQRRQVIVVVNIIEPVWAEEGAKNVRKAQEWTKKHLEKEAFKIVAFKNGKVPKLREFGAREFIESHYDSIRLDRAAKWGETMPPQEVTRPQRMWLDSQYGGRYNGWSTDLIMGHDSIFEGISVWTGLEIWKKNKYEKINYLTFQRKYEDMINADFIKPMPFQRQTYDKFAPLHRAIVFMDKWRYQRDSF